MGEFRELSRGSIESWRKIIESTERDDSRRIIIMKDRSYTLNRMKNRVQFYSPYDMSTPFQLQRADTVIENYKLGWRPADVNDIIELYNIWLFVDNEVYGKDWSEDTMTIIRSDFKKEVTRFFSSLSPNSWVPVFKQIEFGYTHCFWEILDRFNYNGLLSLETLRDVFDGGAWGLREMLQQKRLVDNNQRALVELLKENEHTAEWLLQEFVEANEIHNRSRLYFPKAFTLQEREDVITRYLDTDNPNLNFVRLIPIAKKDSNLRLSDSVRLKAQHVEKKLEEELFQPENVIKHRYGVCISSAPGKPMKWVERDDNDEPLLCYSKQILLKFKGPEVLHYMRVGFEFLSSDGLITLISKISDTSTVERVLLMQGKHSYPTNFSFQYKEGISMMQIESMQSVLHEENTSIEASIKSFYQQYLKDKYCFPSGTLSLADDSADMVTKCRAIVPEIDAVAHRYEQYAKTGDVNEDLLRMSSDNVRITEVSSANPGRYYTINEQSQELCRLFYLFFSEQSMLTFVEPFKDKHYDSFYQLLAEQNGQVSYASFENYQLRYIDYLIGEGYISKGEDDKIFVEKVEEIVLLKQLYEYHACPALLYGQFEKELLNRMAQKGWIENDNHLLTEEERNYFDYYLYKTKYTNGPALRNRYAHGSHADPSEIIAHQYAYNRFLLLLILELLKIEDDLIVQNRVRTNSLSLKEPTIDAKMIVTIADVGTYSQAQIKPIVGDYLALPRRVGMWGDVYMNSYLPSDSFTYYITSVVGFSLGYIAFVLNSTTFRLSLLSDSSSVIYLTLEAVCSFSIPVISESAQLDLAQLEQLIEALTIKGEFRSKEEDLQYNVFMTLRDYLCLELLRPDFVGEYGLKFIAPFMEIMTRLKEADHDFFPSALVHEVFVTGNPLMESIKKARAILAANEE